MKNRVLVFALAVAALSLGTTALVCGFIQKKTQQRTWSSESPNRIYRVSFSGERARPSWPFTSAADLENRKVSITVVRHGATMVDRAEIYDGDAYDSSFGDLYPKAEWLSETTLHLWQGSNSERPKEISIRNESSENIKYLYVKAGKMNLFLLFDMPPGSTATVQAQLEHWEDFVGCKGKFDDRVFPYRSIDFSSSPAPGSVVRFNITVKSDGCSASGKE